MTERAPVTGVVRVVQDDEGTDITEKFEAEPHPTVRDKSILTVVVGNDAGRVIDVDGPRTVIGRGNDADVVIQDLGISRRHARLLRWMGVATVVEDLGSRNGTFINGKAVTRTPLRSGDRLQLGPNLIMRFEVVAADEASLQKQLYRGSKVDPLTQLYNRGHVEEQLKREIAFATRHRTNLSVLLLDVDHFKNVNDDHGHPVGDAVLERLAAVLTETCRTEDVVARYGGEEFLVLLRATARDQALIVAERIRSDVAAVSLQLSTGDALSVTVSIGLACLDEVAGLDKQGELIAKADERLYEAKRAGRNQVCHE